MLISLMEKDHDVKSSMPDSKTCQQL